MSRYSRILYILLGTKTYHEWEDYADGIIAQALTKGGKANIMDLSNIHMHTDWLDRFSDYTSANVITVFKLDMEDVLNGADLTCISDYIWCVHNYGNPGKVVLLGHGSTSPDISAYSSVKKNTYYKCNQKDFIERVFPIWPPAKPVGLNNHPIDIVVRGLEVIALKQCFGARTHVEYVKKDAGSGRFLAASGSAAEITVKVLRERGWSNSGVAVTASPEINTIYGDGVIKMSTIMPIVKQAGKSGELPPSHKVCLDNGKAFIETRIRFCTPNGHENSDYWWPEWNSQVGYPKYWVREKKKLSWRIYLPEYVVPDPIRNRIESIAPKGESSMHLKHTKIKVRIRL